MISIDAGERMIPLPASNGDAQPMRRDSFERLLADAKRDREVHEAAKALTSQALVLPILKELRSGSLAWGPFKDNEATKSFAPLLDQAIADRIASSPRLGVAERLEARLRRRTGEELHRPARAGGESRA